MDTAFYQRTGFTQAITYNEVNWYPGPRLQRVHPFLFGKLGKDRIQDGHEYFFNTGLRLDFTRQGNFNVETSYGEEAWRGRQFKAYNRIFVFAGMQALRWLNVHGGGGSGPAIYYDDVDPFQGESTGTFFGVTLQPNQHLSQNINLDMQRFSRAGTGERVYAVNVVNSRTTYQFDKHFLVRALVQYDSDARRVLTDFLASYEFVPGTVFHAGYGSLYEKPELDRNAPVRLEDRYRATSRGLFFKASYLKRF
jgi:hypothetical protein